MDIQIPDKLYFKIGEVAELTGIKPHVLRYWESEFKAIRPTKSRSKQRMYRRQDIELVLRLKDLLYNQGFTIAGARKQLRQKHESAPGQPGPESAEPSSDQMILPLDACLDKSFLAEIRQDIKLLRDSLEK